MKKVLYKFIRLLRNKELRNYHYGLLNPVDDFHLRYYGRQYGKIKRSRVSDFFPDIVNITEVQILNYFGFIPGTSIDVNELIILVSISKLFEVQNIIEIGTFNGNTALNLAYNLPSCNKIFTVDLPIDFDNNLPHISSNNSNVTDRKKVGFYFRDSEYNTKIKQVYENSYIMDWSIFKTNFDLIFIDGCHDYKYVKKDSENALKYIKNGGIIVWHDYGQIKGVSDAVDELRSKLPLFSCRGTRLAIGIKE